MIKKTLMIIGLCNCMLLVTAQDSATRLLWLRYMDKVARPVMMNLATGKLKEKMPVNLSPTIDNAESRSKVAYLEALGRTFSGIAPWLNAEGGSKEEITLRNLYRDWCLKAIANAVNPSSKDYL